MCGCSDARAKFDDFLSRLPDAAVADTGAGVQADVSGEFLYALAASINPDAPLQFIGENQLSYDADGVAHLAVSLQPLAAGSRAPDGTPIAASDTPLAADSTFDIVFVDVALDGAADAILPGTPIFAPLIHLLGSIRSADLMCGTVTGMVTMPTMLDLAGSTWAAVRIGGDGGALPNPVDTCPPH
jgi:hypothetical protein